jgi:DNA-binding response OmpR family regulator
VRLLLIEDSERLQETLRVGFTRAGFAIDVVGDGRRGLSFAQRGHYDVVVLDLMLPELDGFSLLRELRASGSDAHVLVLTARHCVEDRVQGLQLGADDYLAKPFAFDELLARVHALVRRRYISKLPTIQVGALAIDTQSRRVTLCGTELRLTRREYQILEYLALRRGQTIPRAEIEDHIYDESSLPESNAVESAISTIRKKLRAGGCKPPGPLWTRHGLGYCLMEQEPQGLEPAQVETPAR